MVTIKKQIVPEQAVKTLTYGRLNRKKFITIHETGNTSKGANAQSHANLQSNINARQASWHWQVDDVQAIQSYDHSVSCWAGGDGRGDGNMNSIHIELCVNSDGNYLKAVDNLVALVQHIMTEEGISTANVVQHNHWSGKNCPTYLRAGNKGITWTGFLSKVKGATTAVEKDVVQVSKDYLIEGDKGVQVKELQKDLNAVGDKLVVDGIYGVATVKAVTAFQKKYKLAADGVAGKKTITKLNDVIADAKKPAAKPAAAPKGNTYRVIVEGKQVGAYVLTDGINDQVNKAVKAGKKNIEIERV